MLFAQAIEALRAYSLLSRDPRTATLSVHRLVQAVLRDRMPAEDAQQWKQHTVLAVNAACPDVSDVKQWDAVYERTLGSRHPRTKALRTDYAGLLWAMGRDEEAGKIEDEES